MEPAEATLSTGEKVILREVRDDDLPGLIEMYTTLGDDSMRFLRPYRFSAREVREMHARVDRKNVFSIVAENKDGKIVAEGRLIRYSDSSAEFGMIVHDSYQNKKLGQSLLKAILKLARQIGVKRLIGFCSVENKVALHIYTKFGFRVEKEFKPEESILGREEGVVRLSIIL